MIRVSKFYKDCKEGKFISYLDEDTLTLYDTFRKGAKESSKKYSPVSYSTVIYRAAVRRGPGM